MLSALPVAALISNEQNTIVSANAAASALFGYAGGDLTGMNLFDVLDCEEIRDFVQLGLRRDWEGTGRRKDQTTFPALISCGALPEEQKPLWVCVIYDLTEMKRMEEALFEAQAKANAIITETVSGIITIDEFGSIESFNPAAERIFGYHAEEVIGKPINILMPTPYHREHEHYMRNYMQTGVRKIIGIGREVTGLRKDGTTFPMELAVSEVKLRDRRIFSGFIRDISERRRLERELLSISEQERRSIGQDMHDGLGQMLTGLSLLTESLTQKLRREKNPLAEDAAKIVRHLEEADTFARYLARGLVPVQLEAYGLASALERLCHQATQIFKIQCQFEVFGNIEQYKSPEAIHLYRIAQEAISNAVKHGKAKTVHVDLAIGTDWLRLRVADNGVGFPEKLGVNRGMGVFIMQYRARILGATLDIRRGVTNGTVVTCTLPLGTGILKTEDREAESEEV